MEQPKLPERYKLLEELGSGGMGTVYKVFDSVLDKEFALKVLRFNTRTNPNEALRFQKEAKAAGNLDHKNIMKVIDFGITSDETPYMVLEYIEGKTLKDLILEEGPLPITTAVPIILQIVAALDCAHGQGVVHRDLKSHNVMVSFDSDNQPHVKLYDFGIAQIGSESMALTAPQAVLGTPAYMSPEQAQGGKVDHRTDIYSLGCLAFEMLTGELPFKGESSLELLDQHINKQAPLLGKIIPELNGHVLEDIVQRCLEKKAQSRFQHANDILRLLLSLTNRREAPLEVVPTKAAAKPLANQETLTIISVGTALMALFGAIMLGSLKILTSSRETAHTSTKIAAAPALETSIERDKEIDPRMHIARTTLHLQQSQFADAVLAKLDPDKIKIKKVVLDNATISDKGLESLARLDDVKEIEAESLNGVTAHGIKQLAKLTHLESLQIENFLGTETAFDTVSELKTLKEFMGTDFTEHRFNVISKLRKLESFRVETVTVDKKCLQALSNLKNLQTINLSKCAKLDSKSLELLARFPKLEHLEIRHTPGFGQLEDNPIKYIAKLKHLQILGLDDDNLSDDDIDYLRPMQNLKVLKLSGNRELTEAILAKIAHLNLAKLHIDNCDQIGQDAVRKYELTHPKCTVMHKSKGVFREDVKGFGDGLPR